MWGLVQLADLIFSHSQWLPNSPCQAGLGQTGPTGSLHPHFGTGFSFVAQQLRGKDRDFHTSDYNPFFVPHVWACWADKNQNSRELEDAVWAVWTGERQVLGGGHHFPSQLEMSPGTVSSTRNWPQYALYQEWGIKKVFDHSSVFLLAYTHCTKLGFSL
jgi:hypothetical protein